MPQLTEIKIRNIKPDGTIKRYHDAGGLYLETSKVGSKYWRWKFRFQGKESRISLGRWPDVSLKQAREKRDEYRKTLADGIDPRRGRKTGGGLVTFGEVACEYVNNQKNVWTDNSFETANSRLKNNVLPYIGDMPIGEITPIIMLDIARKMEARQAFELTRRVLGLCSRIFRYGVATGAVGSDPCRDLRGALVPFKKGRFSAITKPEDAGALMRVIDGYKGTPVVRAALVFSALTFCRPIEIRRAEWAEIDFENALWTIPAEKMKMRVEHRVPLARQAIEVLKGLLPLTGTGKYVFPHPRKKEKPMSENGVLSALRTMGYTKEEMTAHGFRAMASTLLNELGHRPDVIEAQLAHKGADKIRAIYNRAEYMKERRGLMQAWADYLDDLKGR